MTEERTVDATKLTRASYCMVMQCKECPYPHVVLFGDDDKPMAQMVLDQKTLTGIVRECSTILNRLKH